MADWFARLMQQGRADAPPDISSADVPGSERHARFDAIVQRLRDRDADDREARAKRQRWYKQSLNMDSTAASSATAESSPTRLSKFSTRVPCRATPEARALLDELTKRFPGCTVTFPILPNGQQAVMLAGSAGTERKQIGRVEHCVETDPKLCNVRHYGLSVETDDDEAMLVLRFRYPATATRVSRPPNGSAEEIAQVDFTEIRPVFDQRARDRASSPRLVWVTRPELETMTALGSREYETFYVRFKLEVQAGIWRSLSGLLASAPDSRWHRGSCYTLLRAPDAATRKIHQTTVDDSGRIVDIGADLVYDAAPATDILLLSLDGDILADVAHIYFTLQSLTSADAYFLKEEFFAVIRRFWAGSQSLTSTYGSDVAAVVRISQRVIPMPAQAALLRQDWANLRQSLFDRYGESGCKVAHLVGQRVHRPRVASSWPFASFPAGEVNLGLRIVYRQEWRHLGAERGAVLRSVGTDAERLHCVATRIEPGEATMTLETMVSQLVDATVEAMKWPVDAEGSIQTGVHALASKSDAGLESECCESSRDTCTRLTDAMLKVANNLRDEAPAPVLNVQAERDSENDNEPRYVYSRLQNQYEVLTRPAEVENVVMVAEKLPAPAEIDQRWVRRHAWIIAKVLLDESLRLTLNAIGEDAEPSAERRRDVDAQRDHLYEHLRVNILHYQRAIWQQEDPQQRSMRYRKSGKKVPLDWRFELASSGAQTVEALRDRLAAVNVHAQFATYSSGREADLDRVVDLAGPIAYYCNYAIYRMRPELGSRDAFCMLHLFKSPYLFPNSETGEPEIDDSSEFRREHSRRITLDTDGVIIDVMRPLEPALEVPEPGAGSLRLEGQEEIELLSANGSREAGAVWAIVETSDERTLRAGRGSVPEGEPSIGAPSAGELKIAAPLGDAEILRPAEEPSDCPAAGAGTFDARLWATAISNEVGLGLSAPDACSPAHPVERIINSADQPTILVIGRDVAPRSNEPAILSSDNAASTLHLQAGVPPVAMGELMVGARVADVEPSILIAGNVRAPQADPVIITRDDERVILTGSGAEISESHEQVIHTVEEEWTPRLRVGAGAARAREVVVLVRDDEWLRPTLVAS